MWLAKVLRVSLRCCVADVMLKVHLEGHIMQLSVKLA